MKPSLVALTIALLAAPAFAAAPPAGKRSARQVEKTIREVAGSAEFLRSLPKRFGQFVSFDATRRQVVLHFDGDKAPTSYPLTDDAEITYLVSEFYAPAQERGLRHDDPALAIRWPLPVADVSDKDAAWPLLDVQAVASMEAS